MRHVTSLLVFTALAFSGSAFAEETVQRRGEVSLLAGGAYAVNFNTLAIQDRVSASWFFTPLLDDGQTPLGVSTYLQHPSTVTGNLLGLNVIDLEAAVFPWQNTGFVGEVGGSFGAASSVIQGVTVLGLAHYFTPELRLDVAYSGRRVRQAPPGSALALELTTSGSDNGQVGISYLVQQRALLNLTAQVGANRLTTQELQATSTVVVTTREQGLHTNVLATATGFFGRQFSAFVQAGFDSSSTRGSTSVGEASSTNAVELVGSVGATYFFTPTLYLNGTYLFEYINESLSGVAQPTETEHKGFITVGTFF